VKSNFFNNKKMYLRYLFTLVFMCAWMPFFMYHENNLHQNGQWDTEKIKMDQLMGASSFMINPQALAKRTLNLGSWYGFHRVFTKEAFEDVAELKFKVIFAEYSYVYVLFNALGDTFSAIKLSPDQSNSMLVEGTYKGEFTSSLSFPLNSTFHINKNHEVHILFEESRIGISINNEEVIWMSLPVNRYQKIGFQGGFHPVEIDDVYIKNIHDREIFRDTFDSGFSLKSLPWLPFFILLFCFLLELILRVKISLPVVIADSIIILSLSGAIAGIYGSIFYLPVLASQYASHNFHDEFNVTAFKKERKERALNKIYQNYSKNKSPNITRILFLGSSQTEGAGAYTEEERFVNVLESLLNEHTDSMQYECISLGISAFTVNEIINEYELIAADINPDISFLNIAHNDEIYGSLSNYENDIQRFLTFNDSHGITSVLMKEAVASEFQPEPLKAHAIIERVGSSHGIPVLDIYNYIRTRENSGLIWWDQVHPTSYGHYLIAEKIYSFLKEQ
jgi:lysophospholipase L1-like esterase